jgi:hypothetical protein
MNFNRHSREGGNPVATSLDYRMDRTGLLDCPVKSSNDKKTWMPGTSPGMTIQSNSNEQP